MHTILGLLKGIRAAPVPNRWGAAKNIRAPWALKRDAAAREGCAVGTLGGWASRGPGVRSICHALHSLLHLSAPCCASLRLLETNTAFFVHANRSAFERTETHKVVSEGKSIKRAPESGQIDGGTSVSDCEWSLQISFWNGGGGLLGLGVIPSGLHHWQIQGVQASHPKTKENSSKFDKLRLVRNKTPISFCVCWRLRGIQTA